MTVLVLCLIACVGVRSVYSACAITMPAVEGPYYKPGSPLASPNAVTNLCDIAKFPNGTQLLVQGRVYAAGCKLGQEALVDVWSSNPSGVYSPKEGPDFTCRARMMTDKDGYYSFLTTVPGRYEQFGTMRPAHIHYKVSRKNDTNCILTTQQYFTDDPFFKADPCSDDKCHPGDPTLTVPLLKSTGARGQSYVANFDIVLQLTSDSLPSGSY